MEPVLNDTYGTGGTSGTDIVLTSAHLFLLHQREEELFSVESELITYTTE